MCSLVDLARGAADIAVRLVRPSEPAWTARRVGKIGWGLFAAPQYLERRASLAGPADLGQHELLLYEQGLLTLQRTWLEKHRLARRVALRSNSIDALTRAARAGWGVALLPLAVAGADAHLRRVLATLELASPPLWLVTAADLRRSPRIRTVFRFLSACFERDRRLFSDGVAGPTP